jgi:hypothetical protein
MNDKGDDRRLALEQRAGADAPDDEAARALKANHAARLQPLDPSLWADIGLHVLRSIPENRLLATAGGVAFFGLMAIFPALATIVSLYGLFADPHAIPERLAILAGVVPASVIGLLKHQVLSLAENQISTLSIAFLIGFLVSMWSAKRVGRRDRRRAQRRLASLGLPWSTSPIWRSSSCATRLASSLACGVHRIRGSWLASMSRRATRLNAASSSSDPMRCIMRSSL